MSIMVLLVALAAACWGWPIMLIFMLATWEAAASSTMTMMPTAAQVRPADLIMPRASEAEAPRSMPRKW